MYSYSFFKFQVDDSAVVDDMFGFLENQNDNMSESQAPSAFRDLPAPKIVQNGDIIPGRKKQKSPTTFSRFFLTNFFLKFQEYLRCQRILKTCLNTNFKSLLQHISRAQSTTSILKSH